MFSIFYVFCDIILYRKIVLYMKKIVIIFSLILISFLSYISYASEDYSSSALVEYMGNGNEEYVLTVPAKMSPGSSENVVLDGVLNSDYIINVMSDDSVILTNKSNSEDKRTLNVDFGGISEIGNDSYEQLFEKTISIDPMPSDVLFGTWTGVFNYYLEIEIPLYMYNSVVLPRLPDWDNEMYPYAFIELEDELGNEFDDGAYVAYLILTDNPLVCEYKYGSVQAMIDRSNVSFVTYGLTNDETIADEMGIDTNTWVDFGEETYDDYSIDGEVILWSNYDLVYSIDDSIYLDGNEPKKGFSFTIDNSIYNAEVGMTWNEWIVSDYNTDKLNNFIENDTLYYDHVLYANLYYEDDSDFNNIILPSDVIFSKAYLSR